MQWSENHKYFSGEQHSTLNHFKLALQKATHLRYIYFFLRISFDNKFSTPTWVDERQIDYRSLENLIKSPNRGKNWHRRWIFLLMFWCLISIWIFTLCVEYWFISKKKLWHLIYVWGEKELLHIYVCKILCLVSAAWLIWNFVL